MSTRINNNVRRRKPLGVREHALLKRIEHEVSDDVPRRIRQQREISSIPPHNFSMHVRRFFRIYHSSVTPGSTGLCLEAKLNDIRSAIYFELGLDTAPDNWGEKISIHEGRVYVVPAVQTTAGQASYSTTVSVYPVSRNATEETKGVGNVTQWESTTNITKIAHYAWVEPTRTRPVWYGASEGQRVYLDIYVHGLTLQPEPIELIVDLEIDYVRTPQRGALKTELNSRCVRMSSASASVTRLSDSWERLEEEARAQDNEPMAELTKLAARSGDYLFVAAKKAAADA